MNVGRLIHLIDVSTVLSPVARTKALEVLRAQAASIELSTTEGEVEVLRGIYETRARRTPEDVFGAEELLAALKSLPGGHYRALSVVEDGTVVDVWLDADQSEVLGCVVAPDRRVPRSDTPN